MSFFPRPVYWILGRNQNQPFVEKHAKYGEVYRVGSTADVLKLLELEGGLAWTAHARVKSSRGYPDRYRQRDFYRSDRFLGAAWKAMPADLSRPRLGERVLGLLDDMANWGEKKYTIGEVDVFEIDRSHELWGHMNINYLRLDRLPKYEEGWASVIDALQKGAFFVTTGEVLIPEYRVGGKESGESFVPKDPSRVELEAEIFWTFPLERAEIVVGDGETTTRTPIDLADTEPFGSRKIRHALDLRGKKWVRLEIWDCATNGAFTQPVWCDGR